LKIAEFPTFKALDLDLGSGHTAYHHASLVDLYLHTKFHGNRRMFLWTYGRADVILLARRGLRGVSSTRPTALPAVGRPARPPAVIQTTADASEQYSTDPLGGPVKTNSMNAMSSYE